MITLYHYKAKVINIVDGDTIDVALDLGFHIIMNDLRIRLYGIDTPEVRTSDEVEKLQGQLSKQVVEQLCPVGSIVIIKTDIKTDKFGRTLGNITNHNQINVNEYLIEHHYALAYHDQNKELVYEEQLKNQQILTDRGELKLV